MSWTIIPEFRLPDEPEALSYIAAVEAADGQALEPAVKLAYNTFVKGCKADGIWDAIKASCILAGARTLAGALVPLVGTAPTSYNFVAGDYNRETGLVGDGSTKYLDANRAGNADGRFDCHHSVYVTDIPSPSTTQFLTSHGATERKDLILQGDFRAYTGTRAFNAVAGGNTTLGLKGFSRYDVSLADLRTSQATTTISRSTANPPTSDSTGVYVRLHDLAAFSDSRLSFYSIGESLDLALLDARVTTLMSDLATAIV